MKKNLERGRKIMPAKRETKRNYVYAVGRRRSASCRVRLFKGDKESVVNGEVIGNYFPGQVMRKAWLRPFEVTETLGKYYISAKIVGGGKKGQLDALVLAISRAFSKLDIEKYKPLLKKQGLLTRDARIRQRRMVGTGGKARRKKQSPKR